VTRPFRAPLFAVLGAVLVPWVANAAYIFKVGPLPGLNWFSISMLFSAVLLAWSVTSQALLDLLPNARATLTDCMQDGVVVADANDRVVFSNPAAGRLLGDLPRLSRIPAALAAAARAAEQPDAPSRLVVPLDTPSGRRWLEVRRDPVRDRWNELAGSLLVIHDVTARKALQEERERLIGELEAALATVRTLEDILPICSGCRRIREVDESWSRLDDYVAQHAAVQFSHGLCPECATRLYPEYAGGS
jgi:PAS domain-containing protein